MSFLALSITPNHFFKETTSLLDSRWDMVARYVQDLLLSRAEKTFLQQLKRASREIGQKVLEAENLEDLRDLLDLLVDDEEFWNARDLLFSATPLEKLQEIGTEGSVDMGRGMARFVQSALGPAVPFEADQIGKLFATILPLQCAILNQQEDLSDEFSGNGQGWTQQAVEMAFAPDTPRIISDWTLAGIKADALVMTIFHLAFEQKLRPRNIVAYPSRWLSKAIANELCEHMEDVLHFQYLLAVCEAGGPEHFQWPEHSPIKLEISQLQTILEESERTDHHIQQNLKYLFSKANQGQREPNNAPEQSE